MAEIKITINNAECNNDVNYVFMSQISITFNKLCVHQLHHYLHKQNTQIKKNLLWKSVYESSYSTEAINKIEITFASFPYISEYYISGRTVFHIRKWQSLWRMPAQL